MSDSVTLRGVRWWGEVSWKHIPTVILMLYCIFPLLYVLSASLNPGGTISGSSELFHEVSTESHATPFGTNFPRWMLQSFAVSTATAIGTVLMAASVTYAFSRRRFTGRRGGPTALMLVQVFPQMLTFAVIFLLLLMLRDIYPALRLNSALGLIAVHLGGASGGNTFLTHGLFNAILKELDEAARIDGASRVQIFWGVIMRLVTPILMIVDPLSFVSSYSRFILTKVALQRPENYTLAAGMYVWASSKRNASRSLFAAGVVVAAIPIVLSFMCLQEYIVARLTVDAVKGRGSGRSYLGSYWRGPTISVLANVLSVG